MGWVGFGWGWMRVGGPGWPPSGVTPCLVTIDSLPRGLPVPPAAVSVSSLLPSIHPSISAAPSRQNGFAPSFELTSICLPPTLPPPPPPLLSPALHFFSLASSSTLSSSMTLLASERSLLIRSKFRSGEHLTASHRHGWRKNEGGRTDVRTDTGVVHPLILLIGNISVDERRGLLVHVIG